MTNSPTLRQRQSLTPLLGGYQVKPEDDEEQFIDYDDESTMASTSLSTVASNVTGTQTVKDKKKNARMLDRCAGFSQSHGEWNIKRIVPDKFALYFWRDMYHSILNSPTWRLFSLLYLLYMLLVLGFAVVYLAVSKFSLYVPVEEGSGSSDASSNTDTLTEHEESSCGMDISNLSEALYFSLSTMTTIGYGVSDYYFGDCWTPFIVVLFQVLCAITYNAVAIGIIFQRLSRGQNRAQTVVFSDKAVIRRIKGKLYFMFQLCEQRKHQLAEAHVRLYCVRHEREQKDNQVSGIESHSEKKSDNMRNDNIDTCHFQTHMMRTQHPDDSLGAYLLMALPNVVVHGLDSSSPLVPPKSWVDEKGEWHNWNGKAYDASFPTPLKRSCDTEMGETVLTNTDPFVSGMEQEEIAKFMEDREAEVIVIVEGIDEITSSTIQCRHSYRFDDIVWNHTFVPCVKPSPKKKRSKDRSKIFSITDGCTLDLGKFHELEPAPLDCEGCPLVPNIS